MTRGQIAIVVKDGLITSTEFNGDMYMPTKKWQGRGRLVVNALKRTTDIATYNYEVAKFNKENHHYDDERLTYKHNGDDMLDMGKETYYEKWFSDYVYLKNLRNEPITIKTYYGKEVKLQPQEIGVFNFGELELKVK